MEEDKQDTQPTNMSAFSASDMELLNFEANDDSLDLSLSGRANEVGDSNSSDVLSSVASQDSSDWTPSSFSNSNADFDLSHDILADIHLPSLGGTGSARKILSQLLNENTQHPFAQSTTHHYPSTQVSYTKEGHAALQHMNEGLRHTREHSAALQVQVGALQKQQLSSRDELQDLVSE